MRRKEFIFATIVAIALGSAVMTSCQKEKEPEKQAETSITHPDVAQVDMNAYLENFKEKMQSSKSDECLTIKEAEWHLTNLENYDCANANVEYNNIRFDTLYSEIAIVDGMVTMSALNEAYQTLIKQIATFYKGLKLENKHFRYLSSHITENGQVVTSTILTYNENSKWYYFPNDDFCDYYFNDNTIYYADENAVSELTRAFNMEEGKPTDPVVGRVYFVATDSIDFRYDQYYDSINNCSRLYNSTNYYHSVIPKEKMCYYLDSYLGLGVMFENRANATDIVYGKVTWWPGRNGSSEIHPVQPVRAHHILHVTYGLAFINQNPPEY